MRVEFTEINKTPLNYDRETLYLSFIHKSKARKNHTLKSVIIYVQNYHME